jgi:hypothetical protein
MSSVARMATSRRFFSEVVISPDLRLARLKGEHDEQGAIPPA